MSTKGMSSIRELYKIGRGPSSSHTMGPELACKKIKAKYPEADRFDVVLYGSLAMTGDGHGTEKVIRETLSPIDVNITLCPDKTDIPHPNTFDVTVYKCGKEIARERVMSIGGGEIAFEGDSDSDRKIIYPFSSYAEIADYCVNHKMRVWQFVEQFEEPDIFDYLKKVWNTMKNSIDEGLTKDGTLSGGLNLQRKAKYLYNQKHMDETMSTRENRIVCSYAFAVSEQNADNGVIVTAPTCGSAGVLPAVLLYEQEQHGFKDSQIIHALATAGIIGNLIRTNASISGAECGCQAEIGSACSMAAAALAELFEMGLFQIEYAAEVAMEHHLGLTCDPIFGLVQIPCIERNAVAAMRAINAVSLANFLTETRKISFDAVVQTMYETGKDLGALYKETGKGGLAKLYK